MSEKNPFTGRRIRIQSKPGATAVGHYVSVVDADTGEVIPGVACAVIYLAPDKLNEACLTYWAQDEQGCVIAVDDEIAERKAYVSDPEVDIVAYERRG